MNANPNENLSIDTAATTFDDRRVARNRFWLGSASAQARIRGLKIAVAGLGGMGSNIAEHLVRLGVGALKIADPDTIDRSNLNRQVIARLATIGVQKAKASRDELLGIATDFHLETLAGPIDEHNAHAFVEGCDVVVDEIDVSPLPAHEALHAAARARGLPIYSVYAVGFGVHFYKFFGNGFTFTDFLACRDRGDDFAKYLVDLFGHPLPQYAAGASSKELIQEIKANGVPIFGPATLLGHSLLVTRIVVDALGLQGAATPVMPEFLSLDLRTLELSRDRIESTISTNSK